MERATPESQGISSSAILAYLDSCEEELYYLHSLMIARHGKVVAEGWWNPYSVQERHMLYSLSKPFTATAIGLAAAEGHLTLDDHVVNFFQDERPKGRRSKLEAMTVRDLLRLTHGHSRKADEKIILAEDPEWIKAFLHVPVTYAPGTRFSYTNTASYILSAIIQKVTGERLVDYLKPRLFDPLDIPDPVWEESPEGVNMGGFGLWLTTEEILRFGQLYLQRGKWEGRQLLPEDWVAEATVKQSDGDPGSEGFGYNFWILSGGAYGGGGLYFQLCNVYPSLDTVIAITAGVRVGAGGTAAGLVHKHLVSKIGEGCIPEDSTAHEALVRRLDGLAIPTQAGKAESPRLSQILGHRYEFTDNARQIRSATLRLDSGNIVLTMEANGRTHQILCGYGDWHRGETGFETPVRIQGLENSADTVAPYAASGAWADDQTYKARICYTNSAPVRKLTFHFDGSRVILTIATTNKPLETLTLEGVAA